MSDETTEEFEKIGKEKMYVLNKTMDVVDTMFKTIDQENKQEKTNHIVIIVANGGDTFIHSQLSPVDQTELLEIIIKQYKEINKQKMN